MSTIQVNGDLVQKVLSKHTDMHVHNRLIALLLTAVKEN